VATVRGWPGKGGFYPKPAGLKWRQIYAALAHFCVLARRFLHKRAHSLEICIKRRRNAYTLSILCIIIGRHSLIGRSGRKGDKLADVANLRGVKVMVIDDSNTIRRSAEIFLVQAGCQVVLAEDGFDALAKVADHQPDVIFCDIMMPRLDGYQTCALIKKNARFKATPVIMLSSKDGLFDRARGRMVGSDRYLTKPFTKDSLLQTVANFAAGCEQAS
jgi:twitching motility two-component system response regulator PilG